ncbi:MAG: hypothetical protein MZV70_08620 [Desulfobacterales bacterium]|nr:hypothetical protein [Desulfobacterales bacterium]
MDGRPVRLQIATDITRLKDLEAESRTHSGPAPAGSENGGHRDARRRHRPRLQQHPDRRAGLHRDGPDGGRGIARGEPQSAAGPAGGQSRARSGQADPDLQPADGAASSSRCGWPSSSRRRLNLMRASLPSTISIRHAAAQPLRRHGGPHPDPPGDHQPLHQRGPRHARKAAASFSSASKMSTPTPPSSVEHPDLTPGAYQKLTVRDSGHGIAPDMHDAHLRAVLHHQAAR